MTLGLDRERLAVLVHEVRSPVAALSAVAEAAADAPADDSVASASSSRLALAACSRRSSESSWTSPLRRCAWNGSTLRRSSRDAVGAFAVRGAGVDGARSTRLRSSWTAIPCGSGRRSTTSSRTLSRTGLRRPVDSSGRGVRDGVRDRGLGRRARVSRPTSSHASSSSVCVSTRARRAQGSGSRSARAIVEAHGGTLAVESTSAKGRRSRSSLPARRVSSGHLSLEVVRTETPAVPRVLADRERRAGGREVDVSRRHPHRASSGDGIHLGVARLLDDDVRRRGRSVASTRTRRDRRRRRRGR